VALRHIDLSINVRFVEQPPRGLERDVLAKRFNKLWVLGPLEFEDKLTNDGAGEPFLICGVQEEGSPSGEDSSPYHQVPRPPGLDLR